MLGDIQSPLGVDNPFLTLAVLFFGNLILHSPNPSLLPYATLMSQPFTASTLLWCEDRKLCMKSDVKREEFCTNHVSCILVPPGCGVLFQSWSPNPLYMGPIVVGVGKE